MCDSQGQPYIGLLTNSVIKQELRGMRNCNAGYKTVAAMNAVSSTIIRIDYCRK
jgi:hypothetical protein